MTKFGRGICTIFVFVFMLIFSSKAYGASLKITDVVFDTGDNLVLIKTLGSLQPLNQVSSLKKLATENGTLITPAPSNVTLQLIRKGVLSNPNRVYFDIDNTAVINAKTWKVENSDILSVKISQNSINPEIARIVVTLKEGRKTDYITLNNISDQLILKYNSNILKTGEYKDIYTNSVGNKHSNYLTNGYIFEETQDLLNNLNKPQRKTTNDYFVENIEKVENGIFIKGFGNVYIKKIIKLDNPTRMVIDLGNATLNNNIKNRTYFFENISPTSPQVNERDILRIGQFDSTTVRVVIQGNNAKEYRLVTSPDLESIFIARRQDVLTSTFCAENSQLLSLNQTPNQNQDIIRINFDKPIAYSIFEEGGNLHFDIQNSTLNNYNLISNITSNENLKNSKILKIASNKTRISFPSNGKIASAKVSNDAKKFIITFFNPKKEPVITKQEENPKPQPTIKISTLYRIVLDPGHGGSDTGAIREGINEKAINQAISNVVKENLIKKKVEVLTTMEYDKTVSLAERVDYANRINPDIYVSIHSNSSMKPDIKGIEVHWWRDESFELAQAIRKKLSAEKNLKKWNTQDRGLFKSQFYVINHTTMPAVLIEVGFMSNPDELKNITDDKIQKEIADSITEGILEYLKKRGK